MIRPGQFLNLKRFYPCQLYLQVSEKSNQNWESYIDDNVTQRLFQQSRECNSKINDLIWPVFELVRDFIHVHLKCKFQERLIKTEGVMVMKSIFFSIVSPWDLVVATGTSAQLFETNNVVS